MEFYFIILLLFSHWIADFVRQTDKQAKGKSHDLGMLYHHCFSYTYDVMAIILLVEGILYYCGYHTRLFHSTNTFILKSYLVIFLAHFCTDFITSKINAKLWKEEKVHEFFVSVGFDQFLHVFVLFGWFWI